ncbi:7508_t:CDS:2 [Ambispora gerdemannii]|uniref:7508_t:CDS:1 n=1 Tax=Ambispora gerdemannii TaxID=144530 RepID=A0A9N9BE87_9GLOM|nr:7508_t:CDS:2 [Ambispora gerdemannii]
MHWGCFSWYGTGPLIALNGSATDNARSHTSNAASNFLKENKVRVLDWPAQSPIKNLWHEVKNAFRRKPNPSNLIDLERLVQEAWRDISPEFCCQLETYYSVYKIIEYCYNVNTNEVYIISLSQLPIEEEDPDYVPGGIDEEESNIDANGEIYTKFPASPIG